MTPIEILAKELNVTVEEVHAEIIRSCEAIEAEAKAQLAKAKAKKAS
jgi:hypothetical protein